ncbi:hypothetical protein [Aquabacterium sp. OR-4]|uniref:hypothetical protein n=1 Tax=Aquabacterium sp. OR-4 TaxID=2978127 RepID=UPI0028C81215|nr:hypothetical protein [Aquabacterium sp. OR-4]MDT7837306.1 hypothetical protein [Aquabacterium sp. OR-4]
MNLPHRPAAVHPLARLCPRVRRALALLALGSLPALAMAQAAGGGAQGGGAQGGGPPVYRCGPGQYSSEPCPGGVKLDTPAPPTAEQQRLARDAAARDAQLARQLADERRNREREAAARQVAGNLAPKPAASAPAVIDKKPAKPRKDKKPAASARKTKDPGQTTAKPRAKGQAKARKSH